MYLTCSKLELQSKNQKKILTIKKNEKMGKYSDLPNDAFNSHIGFDCTNL